MDFKKIGYHIILNVVMLLWFILALVTGLHTIIYLDSIGTDLFALNLLAVGLCMWPLFPLVVNRWIDKRVDKKLEELNGVHG